MKASFKVALAIAGACLAGRAQAQTVVVGPQSGAMALLPGAQVTVPIVADLSGSGGASLGSAAARLTWRPGVLAYRGATGGALGQPVVNVDSAAGSLRFAVAHPAGATGQPVLMQATFAVVGSAGAADTLRLALDELTRATTFADLLPIGVATSSRLCVSTGILGDLNADAAVNSFDALLIVTNAVGLPIAPHTTANGDVDGDGQVNTRDALIVLSYAIDLDVGAFPVGRTNPGSCTVRSPASVQIAPPGASVAVGDVFPLSATVRDSAGAAVEGIGLVWSSSDTAIVEPDALGRLVGVAPGTARVYAFVSPGLSDSAAVTVDATRHVWYVDPAIAAVNGGVELGSSAYPFSSIAPAVTRAAAGDTVRIAPATYGEGIVLDRAVALLGDSTAAGVPVLRNPTGPGIKVDGLASGGTLRIEGLHIDDAQAGIEVLGHGTSGGVVVQGVAIARSRGVGISIDSVADLVIGASSVRGAADLAVHAASIPAVTVSGLTVDAVSSSGVMPFALRVTGAATLSVTNLSAATAGVWIDSTMAAGIDGLEIRNAAGAGLAANIGASFVLENGAISGSASMQPGDTIPTLAVALPAEGTARIANTTISDNGRTGLILYGGDSVLVSGVTVTRSPMASTGETPNAALFFGQRRVVVELAQFLDNGQGEVRFVHPTPGTMHVTVDSAVFRASPLQGTNLARLDLRRARLQDTDRSALSVEGAQVVSLYRVEQSGVTASPDYYSGYGGAFALDVISADSLAFDSLSVRDNPFGGLICRTCRAVAGAHSEFLRNGTYGGPIAGATLATVVLESAERAAFAGVAVDGEGDAGVWVRLSGNGSRTVIDSSLVAGQVNLVRADTYGGGVLGDTLVVTGSRLSGRGKGGNGLSLSGLSAFTLAGALVDSVYTGISVTGSGSNAATVIGTTFSAMSWSALYAWQTGQVVFDSNTVAGCADGSIAVYLAQTNAAVTRNGISGCDQAVVSYAQTYVMQWLRAIGNTVVRDTSGHGDAILASGSYDSVVVVGNTVRGGTDTGIRVFGDYAGLWAVRVDSNTVQGVNGYGLVLDGILIDTPPAMQYNAFADNGVGLWTGVALQGQYNTFARNGDGLVVNTIDPTYVRFSNFVGNSLYGVRNPVMDGFQTVADSSYWGDPLGPRCVEGCDPGSTAGDSLSYLTVYFSPWVSALVPGAPPIPAVLPTAPLRVALPPPLAAPARAIPPAERPRPVGSVRPRRVQP